MDNKKFEQLIDLIINEDEAKASALFHDIVVEKSREIYESLMDEEGMASTDQVGGMLDEIGAEEEGMTEEEDEFADMGDDGEGEEIDLDSDEFGGEEGEEELEDRVVDLEDKLDELMAEFEELMAKEGGDDMGGEEDFGGEEGGEDFGDEGAGDEMMEGEEEEDLEESADEEDDEEETLEEAVQLQKVSVTHGDNGQNTKSIVSKGPKVGGNGAKAISLGGGETGGKGGTQGGLLNPTTKDLKGAGTFKNAPGKFKFAEKGEAAPKPKHGDDGQNTKSIVGESRKTTKKIIKK